MHQSTAEPARFRPGAGRWSAAGRVVAVLALLVAALPVEWVHAQSADAAPAADLHRIERWRGPALLATNPLPRAIEAEDDPSLLPAAFIMASLGSGLGVGAGVLVGQGLDSMEAGVAAVLLGSVIGAGLGAQMAIPPDRAVPGKAFAGALLGIVPGVVGSFVMARLIPGGPLVGFTLAHGLATAAFTTR